MFLWLVTLLLVTRAADGAMRKYNCSSHSRTSTASPVPGGTTTLPKVMTDKFVCKEDWNKTCSEDSECCSKVCLKPFCKIIGAESVRKPEKKSANKENPVHSTTTKTPTKGPQEPAQRSLEIPHGCPTFGNASNIGNESKVETQQEIKVESRAALKPHKDENGSFQPGMYIDPRSINSTKPENLPRTQSTDKLVNNGPGHTQTLDTNKWWPLEHRNHEYPKPDDQQDNKNNLGRGTGQNQPNTGVFWAGEHSIQRPGTNINHQESKFLTGPGNKNILIPVDNSPENVEPLARTLASKARMSPEQRRPKLGNRQGYVGGRSRLDLNNIKPMETIGSFVKPKSDEYGRTQTGVYGNRNSIPQEPRTSNGQGVQNVIISGDTSGNAEPFARLSVWMPLAHNAQSGNNNQQSLHTSRKNTFEKPAHDLRKSEQTQTIHANGFLGQQPTFRRMPGYRQEVDAKLRRVIDPIRYRNVISRPSGIPDIMVTSGRDNKRPGNLWSIERDPKQPGNHIHESRNRQMMRYSGRAPLGINTTGTSNINSDSNIVKKEDGSHASFEPASEVLQRSRHADFRKSEDTPSVHEDSMIHQLPVTFISKGWLPSGEIQPIPPNPKVPHVSIKVSVPETKKPALRTRALENAHVNRTQFSPRGFENRRFIQEDFGAKPEDWHSKLIGAQDLLLTGKDKKPYNNEGQYLPGGEDGSLQKVLKPAINPGELVNSQRNITRLAHSRQEVNQRASRPQYNPHLRHPLNSEASNPFMPWVQNSGALDAIASKYLNNIVASGSVPLGARVLGSDSTGQQSIPF